MRTLEPRADNITPENLDQWDNIPDLEVFDDITDTEREVYNLRREISMRQEQVEKRVDFLDFLYALLNARKVAREHATDTGRLEDDPDC